MERKPIKIGDVWHFRGLTDLYEVLYIEQTMEDHLVLLGNKRTGALAITHSTQIDGSAHA